MGLMAKRGWWLLLPALWLGLSGCSWVRPLGGSPKMIEYTVKPGDTLYSISWRYGYDYRQVAAWNSIRPPYTIRVGETLRIIPPREHVTRPGPTPAEQTAATQPSPAPAPRPTQTAPPRTQSTQQAPARTQSQPQSTPARPQSQSTPPPRQQQAQTPPPARQQTTTPRAAPQRVTWQWPAQGAQKYRFNQNGKKGIGINGRLGQPIFAAADGEVVYSGSGLIGYGNLLIIKHNDVYLSAYGHNRRLLVQQGATVRRGQQIAEMGESSREGVILHFEIRRDGTPVNPVTYLPRSGS